MVLTPCALAFSSMAAPESESRLTIARTVTPEVIMLSAICVILSASPSAFWMSYLTPAALNAASSAGRSAVSQRTDDFVSGRMTPILPAFDDEPLSLPDLLSSLEPQALSERAAPRAPTSTKLCIRFTRTASLRVGPSRVHGALRRYGRSRVTRWGPFVVRRNLSSDWSHVQCP